MVAHGYPKVFGGLHHNAQMIGNLGLPPWLGYLSAFTEFFGGILLIIGLITRIAGIAVCINMCVAIAKVHWRNGFIAQGNYQFPLALAAIAFSLILFGGGPISLDWFFGH